MIISRIGPFLGLGLAAMVPSAAGAQETDGSSERVSLTAKITGTSFLTEDAEKSSRFYTDYLGFRVLRDTRSSSAATKAVYGVPEVDSIRVILLVPAIWSEDDRNHLGISFAEISEQSDRPFPQQTDRKPRIGEPTIGFEVNDLDMIVDRMKSDGVPIVVPVAPSATGRSKAVTVLDPNGIRIQIYQYVTEP